MIRRIRLSNWKAFPALDVFLAEGTSFIVAKNGIGKTSVLQAMHFGLFGGRALLGSGSPVNHAVRGGEAALVTLDVELEGSAWNLVRTVPAQLATKDDLPHPVVSVDGEASTIEAWEEAFARASSVSLEELRLLSAIGEGGTLHSGNDGHYDLIRHLSDVLGVSRLRVAAVELRSHAIATAKAADRERLTKRDRPSRAIAAEHDELVMRQGEAQARLTQAESRLTSIQQSLASAEAWQRWRQSEQAKSAQRAAAEAKLSAIHSTAAEVLAKLNSEHGPARADASVMDARNAVEVVDAAAEVQSEKLGAIKAGQIATSRALDELSRGEAVCPTCLRPLTDVEALDARRTHEARLKEQLADLESVTATRDHLRQLSAQLDASISAIERFTPEPPPEVAEMDARDIAELQAELQLVRSERDSADEALRDIAALLRMQAADAAAQSASEALSRHLHESYREADLAEVAASTFEALADELTQEQISPLATVLTKRWLELWPGRPSVGLDSATGEVFASHDATRLDLSDLSGGERTVAGVLLRLLAMQAASTCPVLLLDEPLEHLDPRNRRMLAGVLVAAGAGAGPPRQVLVTTYEESVTRRLSTASGSPSHVLYIRPLEDET